MLADMKYLLMVLLLVGCQVQETPKEINKSEKMEVHPKSEPEKGADEVDPSRFKTLEDKVNFIMDIIVKDVNCSKKRKAVEPALNECYSKCEDQFPDPEDQEDPPPALVNGQCVQVKLAHPPENTKNHECRDACWADFKKSANCSE